MKPPRDARSRPRPGAATPQNIIIRQAQDKPRVVRVNRGHVSGTLRSNLLPELKQAIRAAIPARTYEDADDHLVVYGSAIDTALTRLAADGWVIIRWPSFYGGSA